MKKSDTDIDRYKNEIRETILSENSPYSDHCNLKKKKESRESEPDNKRAERQNDSAGRSLRSDPGEPIGVSESSSLSGTSLSAAIGPPAEGAAASSQ